MDLNIQNQKIELIQWLTTLDDRSIIHKLIEIRDGQIKDWWDDISVDEIESIEKGLQDADLGNLKSHSEARKIYEKWL